MKHHATAERLRDLIVDVPDFPKPGIVFRDITPVLSRPAAFHAAVEWMAECLDRTGAEEVLAIESRGFIFGGAVARRLDLPLHVVRKPGKLPRQTVGIDYDLEYGTDRLEVHHDVLQSGCRYAIVDDLVATGGTAAAVTRLVADHGGTVACCAFLVELGALDGRALLQGHIVESLIRFD